MDHAGTLTDGHVEGMGDGVTIDDEESPIDDACFEGAPAILGYAGPFVRWNHRQEAADIHVQVGKSVFYRYAIKSGCDRHVIPLWRLLCGLVCVSRQGISFKHLAR